MNPKLLKILDVSTNSLTRIIEKLPEFELSYAEAYLLWESFSDTCCASWLVVTDSTIQDFRCWLLDD